MITFTVPMGQVKAKERPRKGCYGFYTPRATRESESAIAWAAKKAGAKPIDGPVSVSMLIYVRAPSKWRAADRRDAEARNVPAIIRPDIDNIAKTICDSLNGVAYRDDAQVALLQAKRLHSAEPRVEVTVKALNP